ncbi:unnamed protein product [Echinostoma caproni]|uniref:Reverse transcriptase domain-containing protein n=1 Tax=Echinostoma caproni TaxID=27848 RepID=A0A183B5K1_9TREM|nr:unnamed protein product [Echinostoma caproni]
MGRPLPDLLRRLPEQSMAPFVLEAKEVEAALKQVDQNKAAGPDGLRPAILRPIADIIAGELTQLYNRSLASATLPADWTTAEVVPIHKGGSRAAALNYRPASLLSVVLKTFEGFLREKVTIEAKLSHLRPNLSPGPDNIPAVLLLAATDDWTKEADMGNSVDFSKDFDKVPH